MPKIDFKIAFICPNCGEIVKGKISLYASNSNFRCDKKKLEGKKIE